MEADKINKALGFLSDIERRLESLDGMMCWDVEIEAIRTALLEALGV